MTKSKPYVFLGHSNSHKGYICFDHKSEKINISIDVLFDEKTFPYEDKPFNLNEALDSPVWKDSMNAEYEALL